MTQQNTGPQEQLVITIDGKEHTLLMTYGLLTRLTIINQSADDMISGGIDPAARDAVIITCLTKHGRSGVLEPDFDFDALDISIAECEAILDWAQGHMLDFFMRRLEAGAKAGAQYKDRLQDLTSSIVGSEA